MKTWLILFMAILPLSPLTADAVGASGMYQYSVELTNFVSKETGKAPVAYLWVPEGCRRVKAVVFSQMNMTEEMIYKMPSFQEHMREMDIALLWVAPAFSASWDPLTDCQKIFEEMMAGLAGQSEHPEIEHAPVIPLGHSAHATFPWNFAAWNNDRTLCVISFHGDAPRTNLCGYGTANVEWGRTRHIDGIPGLMIEGEYEWWEGRVRPALAFRMMYPESCVSFLCDAGSGHFECMPETADYIARFISKAMVHRLNADGTLRRVDVRQGWLACRYNPDMQPTDGDGALTDIFQVDERPKPAPYDNYQGDRHDAFWYFDEEMALLTEALYAETHGKKMQYVGLVQDGRMVAFDPKLQGGMKADFKTGKDGITMHLQAVYTDSTHMAKSDAHAANTPRIEVICGPLRKTGDTTFRFYPYECGMDNPGRSFTAWLVAIGDGDGRYKRAVQPIQIRLPEDIIR